MYELLLIACVGTRICDYIVSPITYPTESRCATNAALLAGTVRGRYDPFLAHGYRYVCRAEGSADGDWVIVKVHDDRQEAPDGVAAAD